MAAPTNTDRSKSKRPRRLPSTVCSRFRVRCYRVIAQGLSVPDDWITGQSRESAEHQRPGDRGGAKRRMKNRNDSFAPDGCLRRFVRLLCRWRYGVRGAIKPPLNWNRAYSLRYRIRYRIWQWEERVYKWTGLPDEWWSKVYGVQYTGHVPCRRCGKTHWMHGPCPSEPNTTTQGGR
jgi:hypothetical protein